MNERKAYVIFLTDDAMKELGAPFNAFIKSKNETCYIYAKSIDPEGNYFHMLVDQEVVGGNKIELELQLHHDFIKGAFCGEETAINELGFS